MKPIICQSCGAEIDITKQPEVSMGVERCPKCDKLVDQEGNVINSKEKQVTTADVPPGVTAPISEQPPKPEEPKKPEYPEIPGIVIDDKRAELFAKRQLKAFVKDRLLEIRGNVYVCSRGGFVYGIVKLNTPVKVDLEVFRKRYDQHKITEEERELKWPKVKYLFIFTFKIEKVFKRPKEYEKPPATRESLAEVKIKKLNIQNIKLKDISQMNLKKVSNKDLLMIHSLLHQWFVNAKSQEMAIEDIVNAHIIIEDEMIGRKMTNCKDESELEKLSDRLRRQKKYFTNYLEAKDITLVEDFANIVGSAIEGIKNPNDVDIMFKKFTRKQLDTIVEGELKIPELHPIAQGTKVHGDYLPLYDLVLKKKKDLKIKSSAEIMKIFKHVDTKRPIESNYEQIMKEFNDRKGSILIEPCFKGIKLQIHKYKDKVEMFGFGGRIYKDKELEEEFRKIRYPEKFVVEGILLKNEIFVATDILVKNSGQLLLEPLLNRKIYLKKLEAKKDSKIKMMRYHRCFNKHQLKNALKRFKKEGWKSVLVKFAADNYFDLTHRVNLISIDLEKKEQSDKKIETKESPRCKSIQKVKGPIGPYFIVPQDKKKRKFVYQHHYRGLEERGKIKAGDSLHGDIRLDTGKDFLVGWTLFTPASAKRDGKGDTRRDKFLQGGKQKIQIATKLTQPLSWLYVEGDSAPVEVTNTSRAWTKFFIRASGKFLFGSQRRENKKKNITELHEYFLYPTKGPKEIAGRWVIAKLYLAPVANDQEKVIVEDNIEDLSFTKEEYKKLYDSALTLKEWKELRENQLATINNILLQVEKKITRLPKFVIDNLKYDKKVFEKEVEEYNGIEKIEVTDTQIRIPVRDCEISATITISEEEGITALYCGGIKKIATYIFERAKGWTVAKAKKWVREHEKSLEAEKQEKEKESEKPLKDRAIYLLWRPKNQTPYSQQEKNREWANINKDKYQI